MSYAVRNHTQPYARSCSAQPLSWSVGGHKTWGLFMYTHTHIHGKCPIVNAHKQRILLQSSNSEFRFQFTKWKTLTYSANTNTQHTTHDIHIFNVWKIECAISIYAYQLLGERVNIGWVLDNPFRLCWSLWSQRYSDALHILLVLLDFNNAISQDAEAPWGGDGFDLGRVCVCVE